MRRLFAVGLGVLCLLSGSMAGLAHVHGAADHHEQSRGVHFDHAHLDHLHDHAHGDGSHDREDPGEHEDDRHVDHHDGDAIALGGSTLGLHPTVRVLPGIVSTGFTVDCPMQSRELDAARPGRPRDPPEKAPPRSRAPPA